MLVVRGADSLHARITSSQQGGKLARRLRGLPEGCDVELLFRFGNQAPVSDNGPVCLAPVQ